MARSKDNLSKLAKNLSRNPTDLIGNPLSGSSERPVHIGSAGDAKRISAGIEDTPKGIQFGKPSQSNSKASASSGSEWTSLVRQTASGGIASAFTGGFGGIGGIGSLISSIVNLFGGGGSKNTLPPLTEFVLPSSNQQTVYVSSRGTATFQGSVTKASEFNGTGGGIYNNAEHMQTSDSLSSSQWIQEQSGQIAQAVKTALLQSSSLRDVIAEI